MQNTPTAHQARWAAGQGGSPIGVSAMSAAGFMLVLAADALYDLAYWKTIFHKRNCGVTRAYIRRRPAERDQHLRPVAHWPEGLPGRQPEARRAGHGGSRPRPSDRPAVAQSG